jgi:hypothetical protein
MESISLKFGMLTHYSMSRTPIGWLDDRYQRHTTQSRRLPNHLAQEQNAAEARQQAIDYLVSSGRFNATAADDVVERRCSGEDAADHGSLRRERCPERRRPAPRTQV